MKHDSQLMDKIFSGDLLSILDEVKLEDHKEKEEFDIADSRDRELKDWIEEHHREPSKNSTDVMERRYAMRLEKKKRMGLNSIDNGESVEENPLDSPELQAMFDGMDMGLTDFSDSILSSPSEKKEKKELIPSAYVDKRNHIADFSAFEPIFNNVQNELKEGKRQILPFTATKFAEGKFYIEGGLLCFINKIFPAKENNYGRVDFRIHVVYANHTESYMLFASFQKLMYENNGRCLTEPQNTGNTVELQGKDVTTGYIYILRSMSKEAEVLQYGKDFYKIGYTGDTVEKRTANAINEPTYLCAPVQKVQAWRCVNLNAKALETFLHKFLKDGQVRIMVNDKGKHQIASEWYNIPIEVLEHMIPMILDGSIAKYRYNAELKQLVRA